MIIGQILQDEMARWREEIARHRAAMDEGDWKPPRPKGWAERLRDAWRRWWARGRR